ncbi:hypothetical protein CesoFtcFv8_004550 [Champsocephalus esox]|uniref:Uncharacterized protein n=2 Tax=Champsocephalus TaxID=52236 RepID=A0AAN8HWA0_CHAGU|nr:hypothetical protein CesoFtcFv8_004550 [Champsocephalus esox]KAK5930172.1 hypothetical protein CgunFtcFv8_026433 [Champsocephalus gunnari]
MGGFQAWARPQKTSHQNGAISHCTSVSSDPRPVRPPPSSLLRSAPLCVPDNGAQLLSAKGSVAARE